MVNMKYFVYVIPTNTINLAERKSDGTYETDMDGIVKSKHLLLLKSPHHIKATLNMGAMITPKAKAAL